nr:unnamed protein product [Callosobruchus chinensis]
MSSDEDNGSSDIESTQTPKFEDLNRTQYNRLLADAEEMSRGRKRKKIADPSEWKRLKNKKLGMIGKEYLGYRKKGEKIINDMMRKVYEEFCKENEETANLKPLNRKIFKKIFNEKNRSLFRPKKDQCNICFAHNYNNINEEKWKEHIKNKNRAREEKTKEKD